MSERKTRVLVVDDELGMREGCRKILRPEGFEVEIAEDGVIGLEKFEASRDFEVALIDLNMPRMGGLELIEKLRKLDDELLLLVITAYATIDTAIEATRKGASGYIAKPFTPDELVHAVRVGLERRTMCIEARRLCREREDRMLELAFERSKSATILGCLVDGVLVVNKDRQIVLRNHSASRIAPRGGEIALPAPLESLWSEELRKMILDALEAEAGPSIVTKELVVGSATYMANVSPVVDARCKTTGAVVVLRDITALKQLEAAKSMFVSMVAHEVNRPLGVIESCINLILGGFAPEPAAQMDLLHKSLVRSQNLRAMVSELMNLTAMETGNFVVKRVPMDPRDLIPEVLEASQERALEKKIQVTTAACKESISVLGDRPALLTVLSNLLDNAIKYTKEGGHVHLSVDLSGDSAVLSVTDTGFGLTEDQQKKIFDEFYRVRTKQTSTIPGTGLGLALVKRLVEMHAGRILVESEPEKGSIFRVVLPLNDGKCIAAES